MTELGGIDNSDRTARDASRNNRLMRIEAEFDRVEETKICCTIKKVPAVSSVVSDTFKSYRKIHLAWAVTQRLVRKLSN